MTWAYNELGHTQVKRESKILSSMGSFLHVDGSGLPHGPIGVIFTFFLLLSGPKRSGPWSSVKLHNDIWVPKHIYFSIWSVGVQSLHSTDSRVQTHVSRTAKDKTYLVAFLESCGLDRPSCILHSHPTSNQSKCRGLLFLPQLSKRQAGHHHPVVDRSHLGKDMWIERVGPGWWQP